MARVKLAKPKRVDDPGIPGIFDWVTQMAYGLGREDAYVDFASYNRLNLALGTDYDYRDLWRHVAFGWTPATGEPRGDDTRGVRR